MSVLKLVLWSHDQPISFPMPIRRNLQFGGKALSKFLVNIIDFWWHWSFKLSHPFPTTLLKGCSLRATWCLQGRNEINDMGGLHGATGTSNHAHLIWKPWEASPPPQSSPEPVVGKFAFTSNLVNRIQNVRKSVLADWDVWHFYQKCWKAR